MKRDRLQGHPSEPLQLPGSQSTGPDQVWASVKPLESSRGGCQVYYPLQHYVRLPPTEANTCLGIFQKDLDSSRLPHFGNQLSESLWFVK